MKLGTKLTTTQGFKSNLRFILTILFLVLLNISMADHLSEEDSHETAPKLEIDGQVTEFPAAFFVRYQPNTALDMVNQVPGFQLDNGDSTRGYATASGNILINGNRPNAKQDRPYNILGRIPAKSVLRIDVIRGQVDGIDLQGQPIVANIILVEGSKAAVRWETFYWRNTAHDIDMPGGSISLSSRWSGVDYNAGIQANRHAHITKGTRNSYDNNDALTEDRTHLISNTHLIGSINLNASTTINGTLWQLNSKVMADEVKDTLTDDRIPQALGSLPRKEEVYDNRRNKNFEVALTAERSLNNNTVGTGIFIFNQKHFDEVSTQRVFDNTNAQTSIRIADSGTDAEEAISRVEFDWTGITNHKFQMNMEGAYNVLDGVLLQTINTGSGPVVEVIPGSNTKVKEVRGDFLLADTWDLGEIELNYGLGAEISKLSQTGDSELERDFFFTKPHLLIVYSPEQGTQAQVNFSREVSQLDFNDFVSASVFQDDDLALGNPNLRPEKTWSLDLIFERRYGDIGVINIRAFYDWIDDVEDLLPLSSTNEAPGNIGKGRRWGVELEGTVPMDWLGLETARLDIKARWQDSSVVDPVTGNNRALSTMGRIQAMIRYNDFDLRYIAAIDFRQDFEGQRMAWGWEIRDRAERPLFKVNELDVYDEGTDINIFVETTRWFGLKIGLKAKDLLNSSKSRIRTIYAGERESSLVERKEITDVIRGRQFELFFTGSF